MDVKRMCVAALALVALLLMASPALAQEGRGLKGRYYDNADLTGLKLTRTDAAVHFAWGKGGPSRRVGRDTFSVRWTGQVEAPRDGVYVFYTQTNDGARLWVDGRLVADGWRGKGFRERSGRIALKAGKRYPVRMEFREVEGRASAKLLWSGPGIPKSVVPRSRLFLPGTPAPPPPPPPKPAPPAPTPPAPVPAGAQRWSDPTTWGGAPPKDGDEITIPAGKTVLLDGSTPDLKGLTVNGTLLFEDAKDLELRSGYVMVHGRLQIGTEAQPFRHRATVTLTGDAGSPEVMGMGAKVLGVMGGALDVHGERRAGWTRLRANAPAGQNKISLASNPGWRPGDRIVLASTDYDAGQDEERTVTAVSGDTLTLDANLEYPHWGELQTVAGRTVDERGEVALLSRNVVIRGEKTAETDTFGGQIMVMNGGVARVEGAELTHMGQKNVLRRYPIHFHMLGDAGANSYLKDTSIHHTNNRCVTIHGTNRLRVAGNVCHDTLGHGFFFEDGGEVKNVLEGNLAMKSRRPASGERLLPSDGRPASYWITNPDNTIRNNVAAGGDSFGFWLAFPEHPTGLFAKDKPIETANTWPRRTPLGEFSGNVAHSYGETGLHLDDGPRPDGTTQVTNYAPRQDPNDGKSASITADLRGFTAYKNRLRGVWLRGHNHTLSNAVLADNGIGATFASSESYLQGSLVVGETANKGAPRSWEKKGLDGRSLPRPWDVDFPIRGYEFYDGKVGASNTTFANFASNTQRKASALGYNLSNAFGIHPLNSAAGLTFVDANRVYMPDPVVADPTDGNPARGKDGDASSVFLDTDGSVTGTPGRYVVANNAFLRNDTCEQRPDWNSHVCAADYATLTVGSADEDPLPDVKPVKLVSTDANHGTDGAVQTLWGCCDDSTGADSTVFADGNYKVDFNGDANPLKMRFVLRRGSGSWEILSMSYPVKPKVTKYGCDLSDTDRYNWCRGDAASLEDLKARDRSSFWYDAANGRLYLKLYARDPGDPNETVDYEELRVQPWPTVDGADPPQTTGSGTGLKAEYFDNMDFTSPKTLRTDPAVDFDWGQTTPPGTALTSPDTFSVRWTGQIEAPETADYNFVTTGDDGVRLWVCGELLVDDWRTHAPTDIRASSPVRMEAGQRCDVKIEYFDSLYGAVARLQWDYAGYRTHVVPQRQLFPAP